MRGREAPVGGCAQNAARGPFLGNNRRFCKFGRFCTLDAASRQIEARGGSSFPLVGVGKGDTMSRLAEAKGGRWVQNRPNLHGGREKARMAGRGKAWAARRYADARTLRALRADGRADPAARGCAGHRARGWAVRPARRHAGTRAGSLAARGRRGGQSAARRHAGAPGTRALRAGSLPPLPPNLPARPRYPPARLAPRRRPPGACPATPDIPQRAPGSPTRTQLPSEYRGASDSPARTPGGVQHAPGPARARLPDAHLASTRPTTFWPFSSRFTQPGAFRNAILAIFAMLYVETRPRHA